MKKNKIKKIIIPLFIIDFITTIIFIISANYYKSITEYPAYSISIIITILGFIICLFNRKNKIQLELNKNIILICLIFTILFLIMLPVNKLLLNLNYFNNLLNIIYTILHLITFIISIIICLYKIFNYETKNYQDTNKILKSTKFILMIVLSIITILYVLSSNTGYYDHDFLSIFNYSIKEMSNWHTFGYVLFVNLIKFLFKSPFPIVVIQGLLWLIALYYSLTIIENKTKKKSYLIVFSIIQIVLLVGFKQVTFLWKDTMFSISLYILCLTIYDIISSQKNNLKKSILLLLASIVVSNFRHSGIIITIIMTIIMCIYFYKIEKKQTIIIFFVGLISISSFFTIDIIFKKFLKGHDYPKIITYTVPIYQVGTFIHNDYEYDEKDIEYLKKLYPIEFWKSNYEKYDGDALARKWHIPSNYYNNLEIFEYKKLLPLNLKMFLTEPIMYTKSLFELQNTLWQITPVFSPYYGFFWSDTNNALKIITESNYYEMRFKYGITFEIINSIEKILFYNSYIWSFKSRGGFSIYILLICIVLSIYKRNFKLLTFILPLLIWWCLLMLSMPISIIRYIIIFVISSPIIFLLNINSKFNHKK